ncbi:MAG: DUF861 domain-containing protein [Thermomicrobiales bacterium]|nr:DUF861 domain-containing protein [Thermomicrobiales bacterium]
MVFGISDEAARALELDDWGLLAPPVGVPLDDPMATRGRSFFQSSDGRINTGLWECAAGRMRADFGADGEFLHVVAGRMLCQPDDGAPFALGPGDTATFPPGWTGVWTLEETLRKLYCTFA